MTTLAGLMTITEAGSFPDEARARVAIAAALALAGAAVQEHAQENIRAQMSVQRTDPASFFGAVQTEVEDDGAVLQSVTGSAHAGAVAQEFGAEIYPVAAKALHFIAGGHEFFAQHVTLPARPYLGPALEQSRVAVEAAIAGALSLAGWEPA